MSLRAGLTCLLALAAGGCERYPEDPIFAYGEVLHADGSPMSGVTLTVERAEKVMGRALPSHVPDFQPFTTATSAADGRYLLEVLSRDATFVERHGEFITREFRLSTPLEEGRAAWVSFNQVSDVELPTLRNWAAELERVEAPGGAALTFSPPPPAPELPPSGTIPTMVGPDGRRVYDASPAPVPVIQLLSAGHLLWQEVGAPSPWTPSPWMLEDFSGLEAQVRAATWGSWFFEPLGAEHGLAQFRAEWRSERLPWPAGVLRPISRGARCLPPTDGACPWTDGDLTPVSYEGRPSSELASELGVTLAAPARLSRAVIRSLKISLDATPYNSEPSPQQLVVEGSADGMHWSRLGAVTSFRPTAPATSFVVESLYMASPFDSPLRLEPGFEFIDVPLVDAPAVRHVRFFVLESGGTRALLSELAELSLFE